MHRTLQSLVALLLLAAPAAAQSTRAQLNTEITTNFPDNTTGLITPSILRTTNNDFVTSFGVLNDTNTFTKANTFNPTTGTAISINPLAASINKGIVSAQTGPASGSTAGPIDFNRQQVTFTSTASGSGTTDGALNAATHAFRWDLTTGGPNLGGPVAAGFFHLHQTVAGTSAGSDKIALTALAYRNVADSGGGGLFGSAFSAQMDTGASGQLITAQELDVGIVSGVVVPWRLGLNITNFSTGQASTLDAAIGITNLSATGSAGGSFLKLIALTNIYGLAPLATTADLFYADTAYTVANGFNLPTMTITGNFVNLPNIGISGAGKAIFGAPIGALAATYNLEVTAASSGVAGFGVSTNTTTGNSFVNVQDSSSNNVLFMAANEAARTGTIFGQTPGNWAQIASSGSTNLGLLLGTTTNVPVIFGTLNTERMRLLLGLSVGTTTDPGIGSILANKVVQTVPTTVAGLPTCNAAAKGAHTFVTDSNAASYTAGIGAVVAAGGTTNVPVSCDGTNWRIGANDNIPESLRRKFA